jgi:hypothetical protein
MSHFCASALCLVCLIVVSRHDAVQNNLMYIVFVVMIAQASIIRGFSLGCEVEKRWRIDDLPSTGNKLFTHRDRSRI